MKGLGFYTVSMGSEYLRYANTGGTSSRAFNRTGHTGAQLSAASGLAPAAVATIGQSGHSYCSLRGFNLFRPLTEILPRAARRIRQLPTGPPRKDSEEHRPDDSGKATLPRPS